jgi:Zn-dependent peptidase ImmA (M78 family)
LLRVTVQPELLRWALARANSSVEAKLKEFPKLPEWLSGERRPTLKQVERFARATYTPVGYLFLSEPPEERIPIQDFRTIAAAEVGRPSPDLLETIYICQQRQEWYRDHARLNGEELLPLVGSATTKDDIVETAVTMRDVLDFDLDERRAMRTWEEALRRFIDQAENLGILVMVSGVVGSNSHRPLDPQEFRGFALADPVAPLVFINGADTKAAQMFTLAHELAHLWLGESALSDASPRMKPEKHIERWCNRVAAELLVPLADLGAERSPDLSSRDELNRLARRFKVSTLVVLRRLYDARRLTWEELGQRYEAELQHLRSLPKRQGGDYYRTTRVRVSPRFARAVAVSTWEGRTPFTEAFHLVGCRKESTFRRLSSEVGVAP